MKKAIISFFVFFLLLSVSTQAQVAMGKWRTHLAYNVVSQIAQSDNKIFGLCDGALFSVDKLDESIEFYSKVSGLNGSGISRIEYDKVSGQLLIIYSNGNIDLLSSGGVVNIPDLYNKQMNSSKEVSQISFYQNKAYLACNFGVLVLNMKKMEVADTYIIGPNASEVKVLATAIHGNTIYALTPTAVYKADVNEPSLVNYEYWAVAADMPGSGNFQSAVSFAGKLFVLRGGKLYYQTGDSWTNFLPLSVVGGVNVSSGKMFANCGAEGVVVVDELLATKTIGQIANVVDAEYDLTENKYWLAASDAGIVSYADKGGDAPVVNFYKPSGPAVNLPWSMAFGGKKLFVVPGGRWSSQYDRSGEVMIFENDVWAHISRKSIEDSTKVNALDFCNIAVDSADNKHFFTTSYGTGLYEFKNDKFFKRYSPLNSPLVSVLPAAPNNYTRLDGAVFDANRNLIFANMLEEKKVLIQVLSPSGEWTSLNYSFPSLSQNVISALGQIMISNQNQNQKWIPSARKTSGVCVFDDNGTYSNQSDDKSVFIETMTYPETDNTGKTVLESVKPNYVFCMAQDKNGVVWVGTDQGPFLFQNLTKVFEPGYTCSRVKIPRNDNTNLADYLLEKERIRCIAIDGANRKWLGTETSGVYLMSENGQETIKHFTTSNSPLLSDNVMSIAINPVSGEVFFGTSLGLVSYQSDAAEAGKIFDKVYAYPNPVRENYNGIISITGLVQNTQVKITDISGNLICQTVSNGSIATWDGKDTHGRKVSSGVYLAMCTSSDGAQSAIAKILVIN